jgi:hypothetical protein
MARKIEEQMIQAIRAGKDWSSGNTRVVISDEKADPICVHLHGNWIAQISNDEAHELVICLAGWNTPTTRSRLTALCREFVPSCHGIGTRKGEPELRFAVGSMPVSSTEWFSV